MQIETGRMLLICSVCCQGCDRARQARQADGAAPWSLGGRGAASPAGKDAQIISKVLMCLSQQSAVLLL